MERRTVLHTHGTRSGKRSNAATIDVVLLSVVLIAVIIVLSPIGTILSDQIGNLSALFGNTGSDPDQKIVSALKNQEATPSVSPSATPSAPVQNTITVTETPYYILQMGVFTEQAKADSHALQLRTMGAGGLVYPDGSVFRVFAAAYVDEESLQKVQSQVRNDGFEATPYITERNSVHITLKGDESVLNNTMQAINLLSVVPDRLSELSLQLDRDMIDGINLKTELKTLNETIDAALEPFQSINSAAVEPILNILHDYQNHISTFLQEHDTINQTNACDLKLLQLTCITDYIQFFRQE